MIHIGNGGVWILRKSMDINNILTELLLIIKAVRI